MKEPRGGGGSDQAGEVEPLSPAVKSRVGVMRMLCSQMSLGTQREWRKAACTENHLFLCEKEVDRKTQIHSQK